MNATGRPIRFLASIVGGWTLLRVAMLWSDTASLPEAIREALPLPRLAAAAPSAAATATRWAIADASAAAAAPMRALSPPPPTTGVSRGTSGIQRADATTVGPTPSPGRAAEPPTAPVPEVAPAPAVLPNRQQSGWSASGWVVARGGGLPGVAPGSQLGGSQVGGRIDRAIGGGFALTARVAAPLRGRGAEVSPGIAWQARRLPLRAVAEYRVALDGGGSAPAVGLSGGVSEARLPMRFRLEAYAQAGAIARGGGEGYADGAIRVARPVALVEGVRVDLGVGSWAAKQRGAARIDVGPSVALRLPVGGSGGGARLQLDWRQRIAGDARPGSGLALTLGADL